MDIYIYIKKKLDKEGYVFQKKIKFTTIVGYTFYFILNSFANYVYASFQILKNGIYAQKICISNFQIYCLLKNLQHYPKFLEQK
jgi:hypothetical protein